MYGDNHLLTQHIHAHMCTVTKEIPRYHCELKCILSMHILTLKVLTATIDAQWEEMGGCRVGKVQAGTTSPMPDHKVLFFKATVTIHTHGSGH